MAELSAEPKEAESKTVTYLAIFGVLFVITLAEVGVFYVPALSNFLAPILIIMSATKFALVVMFYMHLKFDHPVFTYLLAAPLVLALAVGVALMFLFGAFASHVGG